MTNRLIKILACVALVVPSACKSAGADTYSSALDADGNNANHPMSAETLCGTVYEEFVSQGGSSIDALVFRRHQMGYKLTFKTPADRAKIEANLPVRVCVKGTTDPSNATDLGAFHVLTLASPPQALTETTVCGLVSESSTSVGGVSRDELVLQGDQISPPGASMLTLTFIRPADQAQVSRTLPANFCLLGQIRRGAPSNGEFSVFNVAKILQVSPPEVLCGTVTEEYTSVGGVGRDLVTLTRADRSRLELTFDLPIGENLPRYLCASGTQLPGVDLAQFRVTAIVK